MQSVDNLHQVIHTRAPTHAETTLHESLETALVQTDPMGGARAELLAEAIADADAEHKGNWDHGDLHVAALAAERDSLRRLLDQASAERDAARAALAGAIDDVRTRAWCYLREPADAAWHELVEALTRIYGDGETCDLLRAVTIHSQTSRRSSS